VTADGLNDEAAEEVSSIRTVPCSEEHDGEVLAVVTLTTEQAAAFTETPIDSICQPAIEAAGRSGVLTEDIDYTGLSEPSPDAGDKAACIAYRLDGSSLTSRLGS
jgi:hypothetical protein